jgi:hypothetical protein
MSAVTDAKVELLLDKAEDVLDQATNTTSADFGAVRVNQACGYIALASVYVALAAMEDL